MNNLYFIKNDRPATQKQKDYIKDLQAVVNDNKKIDFENLTLKQAGKLIYNLKNQLRGSNYASTN